jgi:hypothetical protein
MSLPGQHQPEGKPGRYTAPDPVLAFLDSL